MEILLTKKENNQNVLSCKRKDGSITWKRITPFFVLHDICHYVVEKTIPLKNAFYGMVAAGTAISDFELTKDNRNFILADEAIYAEQLVNLLAIEYAQGKMENFAELFADICEKELSSSLQVLLNSDKLGEIRKMLKTLMEKWNSLPGRETMILNFEE